jgi:hypothetical protein
VGLENLSLDIIEVGAFEGMIIGNW